MIYVLEVTSTARSELAAFSRRIGRDNPEAALRLIERFGSTLDRVLRLPTAVSFFPCPGAAAAGLRRVAIRGFPNHLIFFRILRDRVRVVHVLHAARNLPEALGLGQSPPDAR